jgi:acetyl esterase/lipase
VSTTAVHRDVVYARRTGFRPLALDLYVPAGDARLTCLYLHGGGWRLGSRRDGPGTARTWRPSFFERVAELGIAVASVDYRLSGEAVFPAQLDDVTAAVAFLREHRDEFALPQPMAVWGVSAGGQLAALNALRSAGTDDAVAAAVCWYPPTDLDALSTDVAEAGGEADRTAGSREGMLVGGALDDRCDLVRAASPVCAVAASAPPFLFLHGTADIAVPPRQSQRLADALTAAGASATVELVPGATHMFPELDDAATTAVVERSVRFLLDSVDG